MTRAHASRRLLALPLFLLAAALLVATPAEAQLRKGKALSPNQKSCVDCHSKEAAAYNGRASRHEPVRDGNCEACHLRHGVVGVLRLAAGDPDLCLTCHTMEGAAAQRTGSRKEAVTARPLPAHRFAHPPGSELRCGACHDPHGSDNPGLLKAAGSAACLTCHKPEKFQGASIHPADKVSCLTCHDPHGTGRPGSLSKEPAKLCVSCHDGRSEAEKKGHGPNPPPASTCLSCHTPHASGTKGLMRRNVHAAMTGEGSCETCHVTEGETGKKFALVASVPDLCVTCHDDPRKAPAIAGAPAKVHPPVAAGECLTCHNPHASDQDRLLKAPQTELCGTCHAEAKAAREVKAPHAPAKEACTGCHQPHSGPDKLLKARAPALCETCHAGVGPQAARKHPHPPAAAGECLTCHNPHGSDHKGSLKEPAATLCLSCHEDLRKDVEARNVHRPFQSGDCVACHEPHGADTEHLVAADIGKACLKCHQKEMDALPEKGRHAPFAAGECLSCHKPHASPNESLLATEAGALCRSCHDALPGEKDAATRHLPVARGQCLACHGPHGGSGAALLRRDDMRALCLSCHGEQSKQMMGRNTTVHPPFARESCLACHVAHASPTESLLAKEPAALCTTCHDPTKAAVRTAHKGLLAPTTDCTTCHAGHASEKKKLMLPAQHPPFTDGDCAVCHQGGGKP
ncbi:MAG: hypothetical protein HY049_15500 [Acidobacteria bacterium]|nr:hypothetical protein [Acidobacteriota bacterium]